MPSITQTTVAALQPGQTLVDDKLTGFVCRCLPSGRLSYGLRYSTRSGKKRWLSLGVGITPAKARELAEQRRGDVAGGKDPQAERIEARKVSGNTVGHVLDQYVKAYVRPELRSAAEVERVFDKYVRPEIGAKVVYELRRSDVRAMLDKIGNGKSPVMADRTLAHLRAALNWWATGDDDFTSPIIRGMSRTSPIERARKRMLTDPEIRDVWKALDSVNVPSRFPALVRFLLLSARRRSEPAGMQWQDIEGDVWVIGSDDHKTGKEAGELVMPLTPSMLVQLGEAKRRGYVFPTENGTGAFNSWSWAKRKLDKAITELRKGEGRAPMPHWTLHDLRRTGRSLMSRAGVSGDVAERVLGHSIPGIRGVYDRHAYADEKRDALERLAKMVERILAGEVEGNVIRPAAWG